MHLLIYISTYLHIYIQLQEGQNLKIGTGHGLWLISPILGQKYMYGIINVIGHFL